MARILTMSVKILAIDLLLKAVVKPEFFEE